MFLASSVYFVGLQSFYIHHYVFHPFIGPSIHLFVLFHPVLPSITRTTMASADAETHDIIQPLFYKVEQRLDLRPLLGKLFSKGLFEPYFLQKLQSLKDNRMDQNREFLLYLLTQPVQQLKMFCQVLQEDVGNAAHRNLASEMLDAIPPDPMEADTTPVCREILCVYQSAGW